jgi:hemerythrin-like domain-containing protein
VAKRGSGKTRGAARKAPRKSSRAKRTTVHRSAKAAAGRRATARRVAAAQTRKRTTAARSGASRSATATRKRPSARKRAARPTPVAPAKPSRLASAATAVRGAVAGAVAAVADRLPWSSGELDAIDLLEKDHRRFEDLLRQGEQTTERALKGRSELLDTLTAELNAHELIEEKILYPSLKSHPEARDIVLEGYQEHHIADVIVGELHELARDDEKWGAKFKVLKESLEHHIQEEEGEMFRTARAIFSRDDLQQMGARMAKMKAESAPTRR